MRIIAGYETMHDNRLLAHVATRTASPEPKDRIHAENLLIAEGLKQHDDELLDQLILQHGHRLLRYLLYLTSNRETAEDLFQETWMRVLRGAKFKGNSRFDTWLFTVARNLVFDMKRKRTMISLEAMSENSDADQTFEFAADDPSPFERYSTEQRAQQISEVILSLVPLYREVIVLRFYEELSLEEIAQVTQAPLSTVKTRLYRGLAEAKRRILAKEQASVSEGQDSVQLAYK
jgi:RNA polymerase sigma-70 factor (ECF subfamily)